MRTDAMLISAIVVMTPEATLNEQAGPTGKRFTQHLQVV